MASVVKLGVVLEFMFDPGPLVKAGVPAEISVRYLTGWFELHAFFDLLSLLVLEINQTFHLAHAFSFLSSVLLPFLIPSPLVDLCFRQSSLDRQHQQGLFRPVRIVLKCAGKRLNLAVVLAFASADTFFFFII